jgi:ABC-type glycerol-3-phosphate transport system substrate-binding protein
VAAIAGASLVALALAGCSSGKAGGSNGGSATKGSINWWSWTPDNDLAAREIPAFNKQYPNIKVTYKKVPIDNYAAVLRPALASNSGPDVFSVNASGEFSGKTFAAYATDLTPAMKKLLGPDWKSKIDPGSTKAFTIDGRLVAQTFGRVGAGMMWINQDIFNKYKLKPPTNLAQWKTLCATFRSKGLGCFREGLSGTAGFVVDTLHSIANNVEPGYWAGALAGKRKWDDPTMVKSLQLLGELAHDGILDKGATGILQYPDVNNAFLTGKVPMVQMGTWYSQYATQPSLTAALAGAGVPAGTKHITIMPTTFPDIAGTGNAVSLFADPDVAQAVNAKSKSVNAATTFAIWLGGTKAGAEVVANNMDELPVLQGTGPDFSKVTLVNQASQQPAIQNVIGELAKATEPRNLGLEAQTNQAIIDAAQGVVNGTKSAQAGAAGVATAAASASGN